MKHKLHSWLDAFRWRKLLLIWAVFLAMAAILFAERSGIRYASTQFKIDYLPRAEVKPASIAMSRARGALNCVPDPPGEVNGNVL